MSKSDTIWTAVDAIKATGGRCASDDWSVSGISIDTRTLQKGDLFVALMGDNSDGHDYVKDALNRGAVAALVMKEIKGVSADKLLIVEDTFKAMGSLGRGARARTAAKVIGVAGSVGTAVTKEMLSTVFDVQGQRHAGVENIGNRSSVSLSLSTMHAGTDYGVFEMGVTSPLNQMVKPNITIITNTLKHPTCSGDVVETQAKIFEGMAEGTMVVLNHDSEAFDVLKEKAERKNLKVRSFGKHESASARIIDCLEAANGARVKADIMGEAVSFSLQTSERNVALNALAVLLTVKTSGCKCTKSSKDIKQAKPSSWTW